MYFMYKGYSSTEGTEDLQIIIYAIYTLFEMLMVVVMGLGAPTCYKWIVRKADNERNQWYSFFWAASIVATLYNGAILGFEIKFFFDTVSYNNLNPFKLVFVVFFCLLDMTIAKYITERYEENIETQQPYDQSLESTNPAQETTTTPQEVPTIPQEVPTTPQEVSTTPQETTTTPQEVPTTPQETPTIAQEAPNTTPFQLHVPKAAVILSILLQQTQPAGAHPYTGSLESHVLCPPPLAGHSTDIHLGHCTPSAGNLSARFYLCRLLLSNGLCSTSH